MYNVLIFCGGTGSIALQHGISECFGRDRLKIDIVINAYDNGKSTGECRRLFKHRILGPSDLRKNQLTQFSIQYENELRNESSKCSKIFRLFETRLTAENHVEYYDMASKLLQSADYLSNDNIEYLIGLLDFFFFENIEKGIWRKGVEDISFKDFAISNIFYASCAAVNGGSLAYAGHRMTEVLEIQDNVHLISDTALLLKAHTESGKKIEDEGDIVSWNNAEDKIVSVALETANGSAVIPSVDEGISSTGEKVSYLIEAADIIIFSSGTQWSSLIPTYMHRNLKEMLQASRASKYLIMNNIEDADMLGVSSVEICDRISEYLDLSDVKVLLNSSADPLLRRKVPNLQCIYADLGQGKKHEGKKLVWTIFQDFFGKCLNMEDVVYDLDGTLWNEQGTELERTAGIENLNIFDGKILSGNGYEHIRNVLLKYREENHLPVEVFCNYGNTYFSSDKLNDVKCLYREFCIDKELVKAVSAISRYEGKVKLRGNSVITIKPLENRTGELLYLKEALNGWLGEYQVQIAGNTSIDIMKKNYDKANMLARIVECKNMDMESVLFVGNELYEGSETKIKALGICVLNVRDVFECNVFLRTLQHVKGSR